MPKPNLPGNQDNLQYGIYEKTNYWNFSERIDWNISNNWKVFVRYGQFKANLYQENPTEGDYFPMSGSNRYGMSTAGDAVWVMSNTKTLNLRGSYYNMTDEYYNPALILGADGLANYWSRPWYSSLYNSGYVYYPALDVTSGTGTGTTNRLGRQGREWWQRPTAWTMSAKMNWYQGKHSMKYGAEVRSYFGKAARFEPINLVFNSTLTANSSDSPDVVNTGNQWATFLLGALDGQTSARLVPLQTPQSQGWGAYFQDDFRVNDRLTLNMGLRWEYEPGSTDADNRLSVRYDLTQPIPEMQATPPVMPTQALSLMGSKGYAYSYTGAWVFATKDDPNVVHISPWNFLPRFGTVYKVGQDKVVRFAYGRYLRSFSAVRETLGDYVNQYTGYAQTTNTLGLSNGVPRQALADPYPAAANPLIEPYGQSYGRYTGLGSAISLDQWDQQPQINDRLNVSYQMKVWLGIVTDFSYFYNYGSRVPYDINLNMMDPAFRYEQKTAINTQVANPFRNYLTPDKFPGALRNTSTVTIASLLVPYPQYPTITQTNTNGRVAKTHTIELRAQRPFVKGLSFVASYAYNNEKRQEWFDDLAQYKVLKSNGQDGWQWRPVADVPVHRFTGAVTWQIPVGKERKWGSSMPTALDYVVGGWQYSVAARIYSGRPLLFTTSYVVSGNPKLSSPTRDKWFDTSMFAVADAYTPRSNPYYYDGLNGPGWGATDMTLTKKLPDRQGTVSRRASRRTTRSTRLSGTTRTWASRAPTSARSRASAWTATAARSRSASGSCSSELIRRPGREHLSRPLCVCGRHVAPRGDRMSRIWPRRVMALLAVVWLAGAGSARETSSPPGLLFYLSGDHGLTADVRGRRRARAELRQRRAGHRRRREGPGPRSARTRNCSRTGRPATSTPQRGTLSFFWRSREPVGPTPFPIFRVGYADHSSWDMVWLRIDYNGRGFDAFVTDASLARTRVSYAIASFPRARPVDAPGVHLGRDPRHPFLRERQAGGAGRTAPRSSTRRSTSSGRTPGSSAPTRCRAPTTSSAAATSTRSASTTGCCPTRTWRRSRAARRRRRRAAARPAARPTAVAGRVVVPLRLEPARRRAARRSTRPPSASARWRSTTPTTSSAGGGRAPTASARPPGRASTTARACPGVTTTSSCPTGTATRLPASRSPS